VTPIRGGAEKVTLLCCKAPRNNGRGGRGRMNLHRPKGRGNNSPASSVENASGPSEEGGGEGGYLPFLYRRDEDEGTSY